MAPDAEQRQSKYWLALLDEICAAGLPTARLAEILEALLYDGEDINLNVMLGGGATRPPVLTPVERLLRFVGAAWRRLEDEFSATAAQDQQLAVRAGRARNLKALVELANGDRHRVFSRVERLRLSAELSRLTYECSALEGQFEQRPFLEPGEARYRLDMQNLDDLERQIRALPGDQIEAQFVRAICIYRRCLPDLQPGSSFDAQRSAACRLVELSAMPPAAVPGGLFFHIARRILMLPSPLQREIVSGCRWPLAMAFISLPASRVLDRIGICSLLAIDALLCEPAAPEVADRIASLIDRFIEYTPAIARRERVYAQVRDVRRDLRNYVQRVMQSSKDLAQHIVGRATIEAIYKGLVKQTGTALREGGVKDTLAMISTCRPEAPLVEKLYREVTQSWVARLMPEAVTTVSTPQFIDTVNNAVSEHRNDPLVGDLLRTGLAIRFQVFRGAEQIDNAFDAFDQVLAVCVLYGDWQGLLDQITLGGNLRFLRKIGMTSESLRLADLAKHFEQLFEMPPTRAESRDTSEFIDLLLFGWAASPMLRFEVDAIQNRWKSSALIADTTVINWARSWATRRGERAAYFVHDSPDSDVRSFFADSHRVLEAERELSSPQLIDAAAIWASMAWTALHFVTILAEAKVPMIHNMDRHDWINAGIRWADTSCELTKAKGPRTAGYYRALEVKKRLVRKRKPEDITALRQVTHEALLIDSARLDTTILQRRRDRAVLRAERSLVEAVSAWRGEIDDGSIDEERVRFWFQIAQKVKPVHVGQFFDEDDEKNDDARAVEPDSSTNIETTDGDASAPGLFDIPDTADEFQRTDGHSLDGLTAAQQKTLWRHLLDHDAVILEFLTHPASKGMSIPDAVRRGWGSLCFVIRAGVDGLQMRLLFLDQLTEPQIRQTLDGNDTKPGLLNLAAWTPERNGSGILKSLGANMLPENLLAALVGCKSVYICPHRHLYQIPVHALPALNPLYQHFKISYALQSSHIALLAERTDNPVVSSRPRFLLMDRMAFDAGGTGGGRDYSSDILSSLRPPGSNLWQRTRSIEGILFAGAAASQAVICCHGQMDTHRPGMSRLRLWGGGRLLAEDIHRAAGVPENVSFSGSDWLIVACDAASSRIDMRTIPGFSMSLVTCGAGRVTSSLYRISPETGAEFASAFLRASGRRDGSSPFMAALRAAQHPGPGPWTAKSIVAASFVSYGLFPTIVPPVRNSPETKRLSSVGDGSRSSQAAPTEE